MGCDGHPTTGLLEFRANTTAEEIAAAEAIATIAHTGQTDKNGADYITRPVRVAARLNEPAQVAATFCTTWSRTAGRFSPALRRLA